MTSRFEYTAVPAPARGEKNRAAKTPGERFAVSLTTVLNDMAAQGWEYVRAETLPSEERSGLTSRVTVWHNLLIFRRAAPAAAAVTPVAAETPAALPEPARVAPTPAPETPDAAPATTSHGVFSEPMRATTTPERP